MFSVISAFVLCMAPNQILNLVYLIQVNSLYLVLHKCFGSICPIFSLHLRQNNFLLSSQKLLKLLLGQTVQSIQSFMFLQIQHFDDQSFKQFSENLYHEKKISELGFVVWSLCPRVPPLTIMPPVPNSSNAPHVVNLEPTR